MVSGIRKENSESFDGNMGYNPVTLCILHFLSHGLLLVQIIPANQFPFSLENSPMAKELHLQQDRCV